jgi:hypothetical protein
MPESEEDLRRYLREKVAEEEDNARRARWGRAGWNHPWRDAGVGLPADDPLYAPITFDPAPPEGAGEPVETPSAAAPAQPPDPPTPAPDVAPSAAAIPDAQVFGFHPGDSHPIGAMPAPPREQAGPALLRGLALFGAVIALGVGFILRSSVAWAGVSVAVVACVGLFVVAGGKRRDGGGPSAGGPSIVS